MILEFENAGRLLNSLLAAFFAVKLDTRIFNDFFFALENNRIHNVCTSQKLYISSWRINRSKSFKLCKNEIHTKFQNDRASEAEKLHAS